MVKTIVYGAGVRFVLHQFSCLRCGHKWSPRKPVTPKCCGKCKTPYWDRPKVRA